MKYVIQLSFFGFIAVSALYTAPAQAAFSECSALVECSSSGPECRDAIEAACRSTGCRYVMRTGPGGWSEPQLCASYLTPPVKPNPPVKPTRPTQPVQPDRPRRVKPDNPRPGKPHRKPRRRGAAAVEIDGVSYPVIEVTTPVDGLQGGGLSID